MKFSLEIDTNSIEYGDEDIVHAAMLANFAY